ncbi:MAG: uncharacterized protein K0S43_1817 [Cellulosimicrobium sp.]|nr:uncharacterized protein [Cellulosimicrobium sp.]
MPGRRVLELEQLRLEEVELDRRELPRAADRVLRLDGDLRAVERRAARVGDELESRLRGDLAQDLGRLLPRRVVADRLLRVARRQLQVEVVEPVVAQQVEHEREQRAQLVAHLLARRVDVRVVLREAARAGEAVHDARLLVPVDRAELEQPQRQLTVGAPARAVHEVVHRAVHRLEVVVLAGALDVALVVELLVEVHGRVHPVRVPVEVARRVEQVRLGDVRRADERVARLDVPLARVLLHLHADRRAVGVEHGQARADLLREGEQVELVAEAAVVAALGLREAVEVRLELVLRRPRRAVDALELGVLLAAAPVGRGRAHELVAVADQARARQVRAAAQVLPDHRLALAPGAAHVVVDRQLAAADLDARALGVVGRAALEPDELELVRLVGELGARLVLRHDPAAEGLALPDDPGHRLVEGLEVLGRERGLDVEVVVEAVRDGRADAQLRVGVDLLDGLGEHVRGRVPQHREAVGRVDGHALDHVAVGDGRVEVLEDAVDADHDDVATGGEQVRARRARRHRGLLGVEGDGEG